MEDKKGLSDVRTVVEKRRGKNESRGEVGLCALLYSYISITPKQKKEQEEHSEGQK